MTRKAGRRARRAAAPGTGESSADETRVKAVLEQARQNVKPLVKKEKETERIHRELLNIRLRRVDAPRTPRP
jgi:hypothetical protein